MSPFLGSVIVFSSKKIGYDLAAQVAKKAEVITNSQLEEIYTKDFNSVKEAMREMRINLSDEDLNELLNPKNLISPYSETKRND